MNLGKIIVKADINGMEIVAVNTVHQSVIFLPNYEVVEFQPRTLTTPELVSVTYCYS